METRLSRNAVALTASNRAYELARVWFERLRPRRSISPLVRSIARGMTGLCSDSDQRLSASISGPPSLRRCSFFRSAAVVGNVGGDAAERALPIVLAPNPSRYSTLSRNRFVTRMDPAGLGHDASRFRRTAPSTRPAPLAPRPRPSRTRRIARRTEGSDRSFGARPP